MPPHIAGIKDRLDSIGEGSLRVLAVHGMLTDAPGYSREWQDHIAQELGLRVVREDTVTVVRDYDVIPYLGAQPYEKVRTKQSTIRITHWRDSRDTTRDRMVFYELFWAPYRDVLKNQFFGCFDSRSINPDSIPCVKFTDAERDTDTRVAANKAIKDRILIGGLSDAAILLGPLGDVFRDDVDLSMCMIAEDVLSSKGLARKQNATERCDLTSARSATGALSARNSDAVAAQTLASTPFVVITHSLGGFLVMDGQIRADSLRNSKAAERREVLAFDLMDQATVFMYANQIPLLNLARITPRCMVQAASACPNPRLRTAAPHEVGFAKLTTYVAFNDTNDLLDFEIPPYLPDAGLFGPLINVSVSNQTLTLPGFHEPDHAHVTYGINPAVVHAVVFGIDIPPRGK